MTPSNPKRESRLLRRHFLVLAAEDDEDDRVLTRDALAECKLPLHLHFVEDGEELMDYLLRRGKYSEPNSAPRPGLILMDLNMPRKDGREALREIKANPDLRQIPIVVLTTSRAEEDIVNTYDLGGSTFIRKPTQFRTMVEVIQTVGRYWGEVAELPPAGRAPKPEGG